MRAHANHRMDIESLITLIQKHQQHPTRVLRPQMHLVLALYPMAWKLPVGDPNYVTWKYRKMPNGKSQRGHLTIMMGWKMIQTPRRKQGKQKPGGYKMLGIINEGVALYRSTSFVVTKIAMREITPQDEEKKGKCQRDLHVRIWNTVGEMNGQVDQG